MLSILLSIVLSVVVIALLFHNKKAIIMYAHQTDNLDGVVLDLRRKYQKLSSDQRIPVELCNKSDELGGNREKDVAIMGTNCEPWISRECIYVLDHIIPSNAIGLEWSSGSSTIWLSYRLKSLISVENTESWSNEVKKIIIRRNLQNRTKLLWIGKEDINNCNNDKQYISKFYRGDTCFKTYVATNLIPNIQYDFISIDGRARTGCLLRSIKMIKKENGIIIMDNAERGRYKWVYENIPSNWTRFDFWYKNGLVRMFITH